MHKEQGKINIYFVIAEKGWSKNKIEKKITKQVIFLSSAITNHYECQIRKLTRKQSLHIIDSMSNFKFNSKISIPTQKSTNINYLNHIYHVLSYAETEDTIFVIRNMQKNKNRVSFTLDFHVFSFSKGAETLILDALGYKRSRSKRKNSFLSYIFSPIKGKVIADYDFLSSLVHIPLKHNYRGINFNTLGKTDLSSQSKMKNQILIGNLAEEGQDNKEVFIDVKDFLLNIEIYGMIGRGKTQLVSSIFKQLLDKKIGTLVFDIKGEYARSFVNEGNVDIFTIGMPKPLCINIFNTIDEDDVRNTLLIIEELMLSSNQEFSPAMKNLFEHALFMTHRSPKRDLKTFVENVFKVSMQQRHQTSISYVQQTIDAVLNRLNFIFNPINFEILGVSKTTLDFACLDEGKSIILDLSKFQKRAARPSDIFLICNLILKMLYRYAASKESSRELKYVVILEEAINIIPNIYHSESSASLITAENNFLLGRSLGIGHITVSQIWDSVSPVVHGNSATKIVFRSSEKIDLISKSINLSEEKSIKIQRLPTQYCYMFFEGTTEAVCVKTLDFFVSNISFTNYKTALEKKHGKCSFPLLYNSFFDMRTYIYKQTIQEKLQGAKKLVRTNITQPRQQILGSSSDSKNTSALSAKVDFSPEKDIVELINSITFISEDLVCDRLCLEQKNSQDCLKINVFSKIITSELMSKNSSDKLVLLLENEGKLFEIITSVSKKKKMSCNLTLVFCAIKSLVISLYSGGLLNQEKALYFLKRFALQTKKLPAA
ncbi:MAG: ATP-binding protein [Candidatus Heimdallarchaeaceae archaeon]